MVRYGKRYWRIVEEGGGAIVQILSFSCNFRPKKLVTTPTLGVGIPFRKILDPPLNGFVSSLLITVHEEH